MEKVNVYSFYDMACDLAKVAALPDDALLIQGVWPVINAGTRLAALIDQGVPIPISVSRPHAAQLRTSLNFLDALYKVDDGQGGRKWQWPKDDDRFPDWMIPNYRRSLNIFETVFAAEVTEMATYYVPRRGIFFTPALVDTAEETFPPEIRGTIPEKTLADWRAAGRCLAFNLCSASGYHVARAVEGTLEVYYQTFTGKAGTLNGWGDYINALEGAKGSKTPTEKTIAEIKQMKDDYRNPLAHPRIVLSETEARILFANGESLILAMASEIQAATQLALGGGGTIPSLLGSVGDAS